MRTTPDRCAASPSPATQPTTRGTAQADPAPGDRASHAGTPRARAFRRQELPKDCPCCGRPAVTLFRCKTKQTDRVGTGWKAACAICLAHLSDDNPHFVYGGVIRNRPHFYIPRPHAISRAA